MGIVANLTGDVVITGDLRVSSINNLPSSCVKDSSVQSGANIDADKLEHKTTLTYTQDGTVADATAVIHVATQTGTIVEFGAGSVTAAVGDSTVDVDLQKDGVTCLTGDVTLDSGNAAYTPETGTLSVTSIADTDVLTVVVDATVGTGTLPTGFYAYVVVKEDGSA